MAHGRSRHQRSTLRKIFSTLWALTFFAVLLIGGYHIGGFLRYTQNVSTLPVMTDEMQTVQGIVVLTGGKDRLRSGLELLAQDKSKRLLITGVNRNLSESSLKAIFQGHEDLFSCCVTVDRDARNTIENAIETERWSTNRNYNRLAVVTSAYHMQRTIIEFSNAMPSATLIPYPVNIPDKDTWWKDKVTTKDLIREYLKLALLPLRSRINQLTGKSWPNDPVRTALTSLR